MPDSAQEKTEAPSPRRLEEARKRGQIGKSSDLAGAVILLGALILLYVSGRHILGKLLLVTQRCLGANADEMIDEGYMKIAIGGAFQEAAGIVLPMMLAISVLALVSMFAQVGVLFTFEPLKPSLSKINPLSGLKRMFGARAFVQLALGISKALLLSLVAYWTLKGRVNQLASIPAMDHLGVMALLGDVVFTLGIRLAMVLLLLAIIDFIYQKYKTYKDLRMTREEVREEMKRMDGDPQVRRRRREVQMQMSLQRIRSAVPKADVVVTNPTELAVAIQYDSETMIAPKVVAKGADFMAQRIRQTAIEHGIPIVERKPLARALYKEVEVGQEIPSHLYKAVAEILAYVYELAGRGYRHAAPVGVGVN
jgi:flagellar biosynthetic protein FlhB